MRETRFFPDARLNFAENLLRCTGGDTAIVFRGEDKVERRLSFDELSALVSRLQQAMRAAGVGVGDRVAAMLPNMPEAVAVMLATASLGAIFSSCSPDFGERGVLDRFGQIEPKLFFAVDGYWYNGKEVDVAEKVKAIAEKLPSAVRTVVVPYLGRAEELAADFRERRLARCLRRGFSTGARSPSNGCPSITRSTSSSPPARPARRNASCTAPAARCCST